MNHPAVPNVTPRRLRLKLGWPVWLMALVGGVGLLGLILVALTVSSLTTGAERPDSQFGPIDLAAGLNPAGLPVGSRQGEMAPDFNLQSPDGSTVRLSDLRGKVVVLNFWATWCPPCRAEMPALQEAEERFAALDVLVLGVNVQEDAETLNAFLERFGLSFAVVQDLTGRVTTDAYRVNSLPSTFFIGMDGVVKVVRRGPLTIEAIDDDIRRALGTEPE